MEVARLTLGTAASGCIDCCSVSFSNVIASLLRYGRGSYYASTALLVVATTQGMFVELKKRFHLWTVLLAANS